MLRRCSLNKLSYFINYTLRNSQLRKNIAPYFHRSRIIQNHEPSLRKSSKWNVYEICTSSLVLSTSIWYETKKEEIEENLAHLITLAKIALERGDIDRAKDILQLGLQLSEEHKLYSGVPYMYDILAAIALSQGNVSQAQELLVTAIEKLAIWGFPEEHYNVVDFKLRLARIYSASGQNTLAKMGFESCLQQQREKILAGDTTERTGILYINILFWYGVHMIRTDKFVEARNMIDTAFEYSTKIKGLTPKQEMVILYTLSDLNSELGDFDLALQSMLNAIVLGKGIGSIDLPICYLKLGSIYEKLGYIDQAISAYEEALKTAKTFGFFDIVSDAEDALNDLNSNDNKD